MTILIVSRERDLVARWRAAFEMDGFDVIHAHDAHDARKAVLTYRISLALLDLEDTTLTPLVLADLLAYRHPDVSILPITQGSLFNDGSLYSVMPNVRFMVTPAMETGDVQAAVDYCLRPPDRQIA